MRLEEKFFKSFFYPFLFGVFLSTLVVTIFLGLFTNNNFDERTSQNIINLEKKYSQLNLNSVNILLSTKISKFQASLNEIIHFYQKIANDLLINEDSHQLKKEYIKCALNINESYCDNTEDKTYLMAEWVLDNVTSEDNWQNSTKEVKLQLITFSTIMSNLYSIMESTMPNALVYYFYFEETELYASFPLSGDCDYGFAYKMAHFPYEKSTCMNDRGEYYTVYKVKCEAFFNNMRRSRTSDFDYNYLSMKHKTIFVNNFYYFVQADSPREFSMCIEFDDSITQRKAYACVDVDYFDLVYSLDYLNSNLIGYYFITNIGYNNVFYFPQSTSSPKTPTEYIFDWGVDYKLNQKEHFNKIRKIFSSNYIDQIGSSMYDEVYVNGKNSSGQFFYVQDKKYKYSIYPILLENLNGQKEHIFSIIYIYSDQLYFEELDKYNTSMGIKIVLELIMFIVFGFGLLYVIYLTFNILSKYIVISIKNVNYMLKGINIGGENRIQYLYFLRKKQDDFLDKLEKIYLHEKKKNNKENKLIEESSIDTQTNKENSYQNDDKSINKENKNNWKNGKINQNDDFNKKYDEISNYIEKEYSFYDFDEQLLQYRPLEIKKLVKSLMDLKRALYLTSGDREVDQIIDYSQSEEIFKNFKNTEGAIICESNIGNLEGQLLKFDKAIYHLALSLQDNKLKRFLNRNLNDEFDESDFLFDKISHSFNKEKKKEKNNKLAEKQKNNSKEEFSQKVIGILINTRYCRLIHVYYMFFKNIQKLKKLNDDIISGQFMNTDFHTINYYHKIIIQFIYLSYVKNDLVKIGESILDYLEFLIKFKFKTPSNEKKILELKNLYRPEYKPKQEFKKKIFNKILNWFDLFDDYISHIKDNSSLGDLKSIVDDYSKNLNSDNDKFNLESQSTLMFRVNLQKCDFLKGKFCLHCKNYNDALFYFPRAAKRSSIIIDGLIKKKSLKHIYKLFIILNKNYGNLKLKKLYMEKEIKEYKKNKYKKYNKKFRIGRKSTSRTEKPQDINAVTFGQEIENIKTDIIEDINECNEKQEKDILILIDFNIYNNQDDNLFTKTYKIDTFVEQTIIILNNYLSTHDRLGVLIYTNEYQIICPLMRVDKIDVNSFSKDLIYYKNIYTNEIIETDEYGINSNDLKDNNYEFNLGENNFSENSFEDSFAISEMQEENFNKIKGLIKAINYINSYSKMKEGQKYEKYIIIFTDMLNMQFNDDEQITKILENLREDEEVFFLLVGKIKKLSLKNEKNNNSICINKKIEELILNKFGEKSQVIFFENMKKIKGILSNNNIIKDEIIFPNEIYN